MMTERFKTAKEVLDIESAAIQGLEKHLDDNFNKAIDMILKISGKVVVSGMGKSGIIGKKLSATLSSTGTPSLFLHPAEASHGDLGVITKEDIVIALSYGGSSNELDALFGYVKRKGVPMIGITGNLSSSLAKSSDCVISVTVDKEACPLNLAPTASSTATLAMCDALAMVLLSERGFKEDDFAQYHPGGSLGRRLLTKVKDIIKDRASIPLVHEKTSAKEVVEIMTTKDVRGVCGVLNDKEELAGVITDGDVRRWLRKFFSGEEKIDGVTADNIMSINPKCISENELAQKALYLMEQFSISSLFVLGKSEEGKVTTKGIIHIQDLLDAQVK